MARSIYRKTMLLLGYMIDFMMFGRAKLMLRMRDLSDVIFHRPAKSIRHRMILTERQLPCPCRTHADHPPKCKKDC
jgi:hypothetical protein